MLPVKNNMQTDSREETDTMTHTEEPCSLIVWNDEVNTFEWVIETLITVCGHSEEQAEQCAYIIHFNGKYAVRQGSYDDLKPQCDAITERGINATVEVLA
jgi:ATP-dependent Clp protease adaptor protein ClpS